MGSCFVIQPFDKGVYDKRYDDIFSPAIIEAGLQPYRVDRDPSVNIPIENIVSGIKNSEMCLAEITTDNPNVWFELGFAIALQKDVVLICSIDRKSRFPFDVQHRNIIEYSNESKSDFDTLKEKIKDRIEAIIKKQQDLGQLTTDSPIEDTEGLQQHEMMALIIIMQNSFIADSGVGGYTIKQDMNRAGYTDIAISLALRSLAQKNKIHYNTESDRNGNEYSVYFVTSEGERWLLNNQDKLVLKARRKPQEPNDDTDEVPF